MPTRATYAGFDMAVSALLSAQGREYKCSVWLNRADNTIEAVCEIFHDNGESTIVFENIVRSSADSVDCPKILVFNNFFIVHWVEYTNDETPVYSLHRAGMNMESPDPETWGYIGSVSVQDGVYDVKAVEDSATAQFLVCRKIAGITYSLQLFNATAWGAPVWTNNYNAAGAVVFSALCVYGNFAADRVLVAWAVGASPDLIVSAFDITDGAFIAQNAAFITLFEARYPVIGLCLIEEDRCALVVEAAETSLAASPPYNQLREVRACTVALADATMLSESFYARNICLLSEPWAYVGGRNTGDVRSNLYCLVGFKSVSEPHNWQQAVAYAVTWDYALWSTSNPGQLRPRPIVNLTGYGIPHVEPAGYALNASIDIVGNAPRRRHCHLPVPHAGPSMPNRVKTIDVACIIYNRIAVQSVDGLEAGYVAALVPTNSGVGSYTIYMEDPHLVYRGEMPTQGDANFKQPYSRKMHQTVDIGPAAFISGGTPYIYNGKQVSECGFPWAPEIIGYVTGEPEESGLEAGIRQVYVVGRWRDSGVVHRSAASNIVTVGDEVNPHNITLEIRCQNISIKDSFGIFLNPRLIEFEVYSTIAGGTVFYRVFGSSTNAAMSADNIPVNDPEAYTVDALLETPDSLLTAQGLGPYQYFGAAEGGPAAGFSSLMPSTCPPLTSVTVWQGCVFGLNALTGNLDYSNPMTPEAGGELYVAPEFNALRTYSLAPFGKDPIAVAAAVEGVAVFYKDKIIFITGNPQGNSAIPNATLQAFVIEDAMGCSCPESIVSTPVGIFYKSAKGYCLLSKGRATDITAGKSVAEYMSRIGNIRAASAYTDRNQLKLVCDDAPVRVHTTLLQISTPGNPAGVWSFTPYDEDAAAITAVGTDSDIEIAIELSSAISAADYPQIESVSPLGSAVRIVWRDNVAPSVATSAPVGQLLTPSHTSELTIRPIVVIYDWAINIWTIRPLPVLDAEEPRECVTVGGAVWEGGNGEFLHCALMQNGLLLEKELSAQYPYADTFNGDSVGIAARFRTSLIAPAGPMGETRCRSIGVHMRKPNRSIIGMDVGVTLDGDYDNIILETGLQLSPAPPAMVARPRYQRCVAFYIDVYETAPGLTENVSFLGLTLELGIEGRLQGPPAGRRPT